MFFKVAQKANKILATVVKKYFTKIFQKMPNLVRLSGTDLLDYIRSIVDVVKLFFEVIWKI